MDWDSQFNKWKLFNAWLLMVAWSSESSGLLWHQGAEIININLLKTIRSSSNMQHRSRLKQSCCFRYHFRVNTIFQFRGMRFELLRSFIYFKLFCAQQSSWLCWVFSRLCWSVCAKATQKRNEKKRNCDDFLLIATTIKDLLECRYPRKLFFPSLNRRQFTSQFTY